MKPTILAYLSDQYKTDDKSVISAVTEGTGGAQTCVILDSTVFYPQGGGQLCDCGTIAGSTGTFAVKDARFVGGFVHHYGEMTHGSLGVGDVVDCHIDPARRFINSRLHSAGHLLDEAVKNLSLGWTATKGIHYPGQAAVEYAGALENADEVKARLEAEIRRLVRIGGPIQAKLVDASDLPGLVDFIPPNMPTNKPIRIVNLGGAKSTPCGGTHVRDLSAIGELTIRYIKAKKGSIKVAYELRAI